MEFFNEQIDKAISFATKAHKDQFRKIDPLLPYIYHPMSVGFILLRAGFSDEVVMAGILHDVIEDCGVTAEELESMFSKKVASMVKSVSENKEYPWEKRKQDYLDRIMNSPSEVKAIATADKIHNMHSMIGVLEAGGDIGKYFAKDKKTTVKFYTEFTRLLKENWTHPLVQEVILMSEQLRKSAEL